jgi:hypothetical protein
MNENAIFFGHSEKPQPSVDAYLASALETFPNSDILKKIGGLSSADQNHIDHVLNRVGETISLFGEFEESSEKDAVAETIKKIEALTHAAEAEKRSLAQALVESVR